MATKKVIFYSWQSDLPASVTRNFILDALEKAAKAIGRDDTLDIEPQIDRDTAGVPGAPDIATTIFAKIDAADVVVLDVSLVSPPDAGERSPNPNVLIELGYAVRSKGWSNIVMVMNRSYGPPEQLPFDLRSRRATTYELVAGADESERKEETVALRAVLGVAIRAALDHQAASVGDVIVPVTPEAAAISAIQSAAKDRGRSIARFCSSLLDQLTLHDPDLSRHGQTNYESLVDPLLAALDPTTALVASYGRVAAAAADIKDTESLISLYRGLEPVAALYNRDYMKGGTTYDYQFDYWRFVGLDLFLTSLAVCVRAEFWEGLGEMLSHDVLIPNTDVGPGTVAFTYHRQPVMSLHRAFRKVGSYFPIGKTLKERHDSEPLRSIADFRAIVAADLFAFMRSEIPPQEARPYAAWFCEAVPLGEGVPEFLFRAGRTVYARRLAIAVGMAAPEEMRNRLQDRRGLMFKGLDIDAFRRAHNPLAEAVVSKIGAKP